MVGHCRERAVTFVAYFKQCPQRDMTLCSLVASTIAVLKQGAQVIACSHYCYNHGAHTVQTLAYALSVSYLCCNLRWSCCRSTLDRWSVQ
jgi:hypothetical protein